MLAFSIEVVRKPMNIISEISKWWWSLNFQIMCSSRLDKESLKIRTTKLLSFESYRGLKLHYLYGLQ